MTAANAVRLGLTERQADCLAWLRARIVPGGASPSLREIADGIGVRSHSRVSAILDGLQARGHIRRQPGAQRSVILVEPLLERTPS